MWAALGTTALALGVGAVAHEAVRRAPSSSSAAAPACPFGGGAPPAASPGLAAGGPAAAAAGPRGVLPAPALPAAGLDLAAAHRVDFEQWARARGGRCVAQRSAPGLECAAVALADHVSTVFAQFDAAGRLRRLAAQSDALDAAAAARTAADAVAELRARVGAPAKISGQASAAYLARGPLTQAATEFRFSNYYARVAATNLGGDRFGVSQTYQALD